MKPASYWIEKYALAPHPEGGYYAETYRAAENVPQQALPSRFNGDRSFSTGIYFLLETHNFSAFHKIKSDEMWHFYAGEALEIFVIHEEQMEMQVIKLGDDPENGETFQAVVPAGAWFASRPAQGSTYALVGCTVAPGFDFADFEMAERAALQMQFPEFDQIIEELTRS
ncbi:cupin domain-containing protein [Dyadobacter chenwenxiniae]|uniref:Cupin domain-containing protein n=1 Tax=Dyadobacter chenwenxiniae TaxID=2906456 RepID=A0A9X1PJA9_9BACT|nr:cupin domain-containing protein [Dyadobacter chenwenxiniae]MCF0062085.1 cupin domain-containing protein [Dyadobacter chenwenxiniae]UON86400.1 cupin domain-containing protein [Dyadobacter chenwenxiniae]